MSERSLYLVGPRTGDLLLATRQGQLVEWPRVRVLLGLSVLFDARVSGELFPVFEIQLDHPTPGVPTSGSCVPSIRTTHPSEPDKGP